MGKLLSLGSKLKYPITISKLHKNLGDKISKQDALLEYKWTWSSKVGDPLTDDVFDMEQTTYGDWDSPVDGTIKSWKVKEGQVIERDMKFLEVDEDCPHSVQFQGLCGMCGKDMTEVSWASSSNDTDLAQINMIHDHTSLKVSQDEASKAEEELQRRLLKYRKLSLVVDLDQTIIHACIEPTVGEWRDDPTSPNHEAVKNVKSFQLDDGPRGLASGCWYYIKMRPGLAEFLTKISEMYELHVYTMGTRAYALNIAKIVDPDKKLFGDRIISRDENGNVTAKSLSRLFLVDTKMVCIIDDRADVWPRNRPNLIKVVPYDFFTGIGDINSSFLPKREDLPKMTPVLEKMPSEKGETKSSNVAEKLETDTGEEAIENQSSLAGEESSKNEPSNADGTRISALEELVRMGGGDDQAKLQEQAAEQEKFLEKQLTERPLLHMQAKLDQEDDMEASEDQNGITVEPHRHNLLKDDDEELLHLEKHLSALHKAFYDEYDGAVISARGGRVAQLKPGISKKISIKDVGADLDIVPDVGVVMPRLKQKTFEGCTIVLSGLVPLNADIMRSEIALQAASFGANVQNKVSRRITHLVASTSRTRTNKVKQAAKYGSVKIVNQQWLLDSMSKWEKQDENPYLVQIHESDRRVMDGNNSMNSSIHDSDESSDDSASEANEDIDDDSGNSIVPRASQEESIDDEGVMPDEFEGGHSPIEDLKTFDWGGADDELAEFMGSDSEGNESDTSVASDSSLASGRTNGSANGKGKKKRKHGESTGEDDENDEGSTLAKKQKMAKERTTSLKTVKTPNSGDSESSLPTPAVTGDEDSGEFRDGDGDGEADSGDDDFGDDLEAEMLAEFEREEAEQAASDSATGS